MHLSFLTEWIGIIRRLFKALNRPNISSTRISSNNVGTTLTLLQNMYPLRPYSGAALNSSSLKFVYNFICKYNFKIQNLFIHLKHLNSMSTLLIYQSLLLRPTNRVATETDKDCTMSAAATTITSEISV